ncbi:MAG TPA: hypothetical protein VF629_06200 [Hymenobacter sp.]|jgi:hypothetical protein|uniref:hypothetical protein n=1 Tax=Hymenobacter sp. TaxID=1898978 RepID=UPI002ED8B997
MKPTLLLAAFLLLLSSCAPTTELPPAAESGVRYPAYFYVTSPAALLYERTTSSVGKPGLGIGEKVEVIGHKSRWYQIKHQGRTYFVLDSFLKPVAAAPGS